MLDGWDIHLASDDLLTRWYGQPLDGRSDRAGDNLWCRPSPDAPWRLDILIGDGDRHEWIYRRDPSIRRPWADAVLTSADGVPYLAPELQLLFKSKGLRPKDDVDATTVIPELESERRTWLAQHLAADHPWQTTVAGRRARQAMNAMTGSDPEVALIAAGRSSQAWATVDGDRPPYSVICTTSPPLDGAPSRTVLMNSEVPPAQKPTASPTAGSTQPSGPLTDLSWRHTPSQCWNLIWLRRSLCDGTRSWLQRRNPSAPCTLICTTSTSSTSTTS